MLTVASIIPGSGFEWFCNIVQAKCAPEIIYSRNGMIMCEIQIAMWICTAEMQLAKCEMMRRLNEESERERVRRAFIWFTVLACFCLSGIWCRCSSKCSMSKCVQINWKCQERKRYQYRKIDVRQDNITQNPACVAYFYIIYLVNVFCSAVGVVFDVISCTGH